MQRIPRRDLRNVVSSVLRRAMAGEWLRAGRDAADLVPVEDTPTWISGTRAHELITSAQADFALSQELEDACPDDTGRL